MMELFLLTALGAIGGIVAGIGVLMVIFTHQYAYGAVALTFGLIVHLYLVKRAKDEGFL